ncbi:hypothetical protein P3102_33300 [Amycolatopsis sp. QT-25]|uniref:hypothetical protein n=1 Tax=Amycolatopsis sp. QT-25 TaxID=3034022 RepID=UPI0023EBC72F|nr:hypothetical protein [Amycolatopsis sp. QT-25]WET78867.1 hypothetical protein P3102_33300 [Amycolatopsis sp. QT-25]
MGVRVHAHWVFVADGDGGLFDYRDKVMRALLHQERCLDGFVDSAASADAARAVMGIEADISGDDLSRAIAEGHAAVRAALHSAGIGTPDWPAHGEALFMVSKDLRTE